MTMTDHANGKSSHPIHIVHSAGRWQVQVVLPGNQIFTAKGSTADRALENLANEIRRGKEENNDND